MKLKEKEPNMAAFNDYIVKKDFMIKRAQLRSRFTSENYRSRWFILTSDHLRYHDGGLEKGPGKEKGRLNLAQVKIVENVDNGALDNRQHALQVVYTDGNTLEFYTLYIIATSEDQRNDWVMTLRDLCSKNNAKFLDKYHPGVWTTRNRAYSCCGQTDKNAPGCEPTSTNQSDGHFNQGRDTSAASLIKSTSSSTVNPSSKTPYYPSTPPRSTKTVIALFDYDAAEADDLSLAKHEEYQILDDTREHWWRAMNKNGQSGYIPANYVQEKTKDGLERFEWYYAEISRQRCEEVLKEDGREGCYLVRNSSQKGMYTLSILTKEKPEGTVRHYHIKKNSTGQYYLSNNHPHPSIPQLIHYHKHNCAGLVVRLKATPGFGRHQPATAGFGHDKWEIDSSELQLGLELGRGQFGTVFKAKWRGAIEVAVKMMHQGTMSEDDFIEEARTMKQLQHPNLVQLYGVCTKRRPIYIVTEFMKHGSLLNYLRRHKHRLLQSNKAGLLLDMCLQVCKAMAYLEEQSFIHRDLAARNCLVGEENVVKVADFGLARYVLDDEYTSSSGTKFPIKWAPPEVLCYTRFSSKSDVWSFGILMWEIFTGGDMPYGRMRNAEVAEFIQKNKRLDKPGACPSIIYEQMYSCWHREADRRPRFQEIQNELSKLVEDGEYVD
ncbi:tyrosine-protein kinase Tec-like isoform X1 [Lingula anatina]|uniref:Tyrosine-protein kinase n=1 Tax=Lingula anatina TaxID=7574 RepID=A0A1S3JTV4_LINAN|nr:tyrosine-protein kinase Tec-like isoform X1 [Lingula anatina]|eukprot:XP_013413800.1 tyrosine-protein kinase Tec-like isoform X1 [Lingula anatina]